MQVKYIMTIDTSDARRWEAGWKGHELAQLKRLSKLTLEQKIRWLESAQEMVHTMQAALKPGPGESKGMARYSSVPER